jgi:hypothetical protein
MVTHRLVVGVIRYLENSVWGEFAYVVSGAPKRYTYLGESFLPPPQSLLDESAATRTLRIGATRFSLFKETLVENPAVLDREDKFIIMGRRTLNSSVETLE